MTHLEISKALGLSRGYFSRLARAGCPTESVDAARSWITERTKSIGSTPAPATLTDARLRKVLLECSLLQIRLERESNNTGFLPVASVTAAATSFLRWSLINQKLQADALAEALAATSTPIEARRLLEELISTSWGMSAVTMMGQTSIDPRLVAAFKAAIKMEFAKVTDEDLDKWIEATKGRAHGLSLCRGDGVIGPKSKAHEPI